ncbi:hypothetical protein PF005_g16165 [Phytophthora fragariae]|uniref:RxLR effector protein n=1 Tax=Phytophthora fragariae TaxID=53985 RepID=A0A6A3EN41_9STRA|nr:hypothetical protein PF003_g11357 [Phytophthora fragariae]KAE8932780.1 hypothetical protein PF009_g17206 [Phytophthora fragariae]KAE8998711.1 hypothetical protein PF011_g14944 [Phytophthora fragariae]KAE9104685.1 hypothetical protein PF007_g13974 [Phytophthora fragariae]KAE9113626.1 hypothetical protein PF006_g19702 [Phytophthora fragariae]
MRLSVFLVLVVATFALSCNILVSAEKSRHLKGTQTDGLTVEDEERGNFDVLLTKMKSAGMIGAGEKAATNVAAAGNKWQNALKKMKDLETVESQTTGAVNGAAKNWQKLSKAVESGAHLKKLDTTNSKWKTTFAKLKEGGQLKGVTETQAIKITETAAAEVAKNPSKWRYVKKFLELSFGAALTALIVVGFNSMIS